ncbi:MAG: hypothetical protein EZS28_001314 [Streblomastix strix]|uniref:Uncharacterized protein n=1 Tax=Streblomastix strix TaxID=222440 RepID=A0A5J4X7D7_9EUKA|nr:MAG: hypothetical protein EZS28_001314 [Streblomastix strix]
MIRKRSSNCLNWFQIFGDKQIQAELINVGYGRSLIIYISTAGGREEEGDEEIYDGLYYIYNFLGELCQGRNYSPFFPEQLALSKTCIEQIEEEGGNEEVESQMINNQNIGNFNYRAIKTEGQILNFYIDRSNTRPQLQF